MSGTSRPGQAAWCREVPVRGVSHSGLGYRARNEALVGACLLGRAGFLAPGGRGLGLGRHHGGRRGGGGVGRDGGSDTKSAPDAGGWGIADRFGSRAVMVTSDAARMVVIAVTAVLTMGGPDIAVLAVTAVLFGIADAMFMPAAGAMPPRLVEPDRLAALNGMMTFVRRASLMLGAPLGGLLAAGPGPAAAFAFNSATFAVSLVCLLLVRLRPAARRETGTVRRNIGEGLRTVGSTPVLRWWSWGSPARTTSGWRCWRSTAAGARPAWGSC
ncbi:MFS transporter [[Actinomadura] parvosata]|uniref:MFS transporter n=1 Tax=[Actinomadura] parvosata TaxID=1955412 RepID=UPI0022A81DCF